MIPHKPFYFIRHGETDWNKKEILMGTMDIPLNYYGIKQASSAAKLLIGEDIDLIISSPLQRAVKTAEIISGTIQKPITIVDNLKECCWGSYEGQPNPNASYINQWLGGALLPGAETIHEFNFRVISAIKFILTLPGHVLVVSHGGVYCVIQRILSLPGIYIENCAPIFHQPAANKLDPWVIRKI